MVGVGAPAGGGGFGERGRGRGRGRGVGRDKGIIGQTIKIIQGPYMVFSVLIDTYRLILFPSFIFSGSFINL